VTLAVGADRASLVDRVVEGWSRRLAARSTRRSFLGKVGRTSVLVAAGPSLATLLAGRADARVCGQSGVSPKCPTYDCVGPGTTWGWCWYASGDVCCAGGGLKKICDCCKLAHPNVHGYCPAGTNVYCIVESCHADPRLMAVGLQRFGGGDAPFVAAAVSRARFPTGAVPANPPVLADGDDARMIAVAAPLAVATGAPLLLVRRTHVPAATIAELQRLGVAGVRIVGSAIGPAVDAELARYTLAIERVASGQPDAAVAVEVARRVLATSSRRRAVGLGVDPSSVNAAPAVGAVAATARLPVVLDAASLRTLAAEGRLDAAYVVGPELAADTTGIPGPVPLTSDSGPRLARLVAATIVDQLVLVGYDVWLSPENDAVVAAGLAGTAGVLLPRAAHRLDGEAEQWLLARPDRTTRAYWVADDLDDDSTLRLQSALNHFDADRLQGVSGEGLPVISQPFPEREMGQARVAGAVPDTPEASAGQWVSRANPEREG
jgi:hypothetical protein